MMKSSMSAVGKGFSCHRMLLEYAQKFYVPALANYASLAADSSALAREMASYLEKLRTNWGAIRIEGLASSNASILNVGETISIRAKVYLASLSAEDVAVELYYGQLSSQGEIEEPKRQEMKSCGRDGQSTVYCADVICDATGRQGFTLRILPKHRALVHPFLPGLVKWG
jgi:starch phosphorylase